MLYEVITSSAVPNKMDRNNSGKTFEDVTSAGGFGHIQKGHGIAFGDLDRDGDADIFECLGGAFDGDVRITSYNVCYTKLLRPLRSAPGGVHVQRWRRLG